MKLEAPQAILLALVIYGMAINVRRLGKTVRYRCDLADVLVMPAVILGLLYWGGFFG